MRTVLTHGLKAECPMVQAGEWPHCYGHATESDVEQALAVEHVRQCWLLVQSPLAIVGDGSTHESRVVFALEIAQAMRWYLVRALEVFEGRADPGPVT